MNRWTQSFCRTGVLGMVLLSIVGAGVVPVVAQIPTSAPKLPPAEEVIAKWIDAQGGVTAIERLRSRVVKGTFEVVGQNLKGPMVAYSMAPDKQYTLTELQGFGKVENGTSDGVAWEIAPTTGPRLMQEYERELSLREATLHWPAHWKDYYQRVETVGTAKVEDRDTYKVVMTTKGGTPETIYFDAKTYLPAKLEFKLNNPMGEIPVEFTFFDYKKTDGITMAMRVRQSLGGGVQTAEIITTEVQYNVEIPADNFKVPPAVQALVDQKKTTSAPAAPSKSAPDKAAPGKGSPTPGEPKKGKP